MSKLWNSSWWKHSQLRTLGTQRWMSKCGFYFDCFSCSAACSYQLNMNNMSVCSKVTPPWLNSPQPHTPIQHIQHIAIQSGKKENIVMRSASISSPPHHTLTHLCSSRLAHTWLWLQRSSWSQENNNNKHGVFRFRVNTICIGCYNLKICYLAWLNCVISLTKSNSERNL